MSIAQLAATNIVEYVLANFHSGGCFMKALSFTLLILFMTFNLNAKIAEKDLSILLETSLSPKISMKEPYFQKSWFSEVSKRYELETDIGNGFEVESPIGYWQLVSIRVAPCVAIVPSRVFNADKFCWPQVRTVWSPVIDKFKSSWGATLQDYSDDRAIHALYWVSPEVFGFVDNGLFQRVKTTAEKTPQNLRSLSKVEVQNWEGLRFRVANSLIQAVVNLRGSGVSNSKYEGFGLRPELFGNNQDFRIKVIDFIKKFTSKEALTELTAFSLPAGRNHAGDDQWVFLAFDAQAGKLSSKKLIVHDKNTGQPLHQGTLTQNTSMTLDDPHFYEINDPFAQVRLKEQVLLDVQDRSKIESQLFSKKPLLVGETSCATCHKFNSIRFNFHNFSKFEDRPTTISEILKHDVRLDLEWLKNNNIGQ